MQEFYNGEPWFGDSILKTLKAVNPSLAFNHPVTNAHSIAELLSHIIAWQKLLLKRLQGDDQFAVDQMTSFQWEFIDNDQKTAWSTLLITFEDDYKEIIRSLQNTNDSLLNKRVAGREYNFQYLIQGILQHNIYHLGQIAVLRK